MDKGNNTAKLASMLLLLTGHLNPFVAEMFVFDKVIEGKKKANQPEYMKCKLSSD